MLLEFGKNVNVDEMSFVKAKIEGSEKEEVDLMVTLIGSLKKKEVKVSFDIISVPHTEDRYVINPSYRKKTLSSHYFKEYSGIVHSVLEEAKRRKKKGEEVKEGSNTDTDTKPNNKADNKVKEDKKDNTPAKKEKVATKPKIETEEVIVKALTSFKVNHPKRKRKIKIKEGEVFKAEKRGEVISAKKKGADIFFQEDEVVVVEVDGRCHATTTKGSRCKNETDGVYCHVHSK